MSDIHPYDEEVIDKIIACFVARSDVLFKEELAKLSRQDLKLMKDALARPRPNPDGQRCVTYATVRDALEENAIGEENAVLHIEVRFSNGEKYAAITVDAQEEMLAHQVAALIAGLPAIKNEVEE